MRRQAVAGGLHKRQVARPAHGRGVDVERGQRHGVGTQLVVKRKAGVAVSHVDGLGSHVNRPVVHRSGLGVAPRPFGGQGHVQRLGHVDRGLVVHVFVGQHQPPKVQVVVPRACLGQQGQGLAQHLSQVGAGVGQAGQGQVPAAGVGHLAGVVKRVGVCHGRCRAGVVGLAGGAQRALCVACNPPLLEPAHMAQFPQGRVQFGAVRNVQTGQGLRPGVGQCQRALAAVAQGVGQRGGVHLAKAAVVHGRGWVCPSM